MSASKSKAVKTGCTFIPQRDTGNTVCCGAKIIGRTKISESQRRLGTPSDDKGFTGSTEYCYRHQIFESWWPYCCYCQSKRVAYDAKKETAGLCFVCIQDKVYEYEQDIELTDPILSGFVPKSKVVVPATVPSPNGAWTTVIKKTITAKPTNAAPKSTKDEFPELSPIKARAMQSDVVKEAQRQAEATRLAALTAEAALKQAMAAEELRLATEMRDNIAKKERENSDALAAAFAAGFTPQMTESLLAVIRAR